MDNAHFDELMGELSLTADTRLTWFARRDPNRFGNLLIKMLETAVGNGMSAAGLYMRVNDVVGRASREVSES